MQVDHEKEELVRDFMLAVAPSNQDAAVVLERAEELADAFIGWREIERKGLQ